MDRWIDRWIDNFVATTCSPIRGTFSLRLSEAFQQRLERALFGHPILGGFPQNLLGIALENGIYMGFIWDLRGLNCGLLGFIWDFMGFKGI